MLVFHLKFVQLFNGKIASVTVFPSLLLFITVAYEKCEAHKIVCQHQNDYYLHRMLVCIRQCNVNINTRAAAFSDGIIVIFDASIAMTHSRIVKNCTNNNVNSTDASITSQPRQWNIIIDINENKLNYRLNPIHGY